MQWCCQKRSGTVLLANNTVKNREKVAKYSKLVIRLHLSCEDACYVPRKNNPRKNDDFMRDCRELGEVDSDLRAMLLRFFKECEDDIQSILDFVPPNEFYVCGYRKQIKTENYPQMLCNEPPEYWKAQQAIYTLAEGRKTDAKIVVIDNTTYLKNETEKAKDALPLMKHLKTLKTRYNLSLLVLAHTPKRDLSKPLTRNDLHGSKMLINFTDNAFKYLLSRLHLAGLWRNTEPQPGTVRNTHGKKSGAVSGSWSHLALEGEDKEYSGTQPLRDFQRAGENCHG
mgnify:CR=1 FL=1